MAGWNILPSDDVLGKQTLSLIEAQELLLSVYVEEQEKWNKDITQLEGDLLRKEKELRTLLGKNDSWWRRVVNFITRNHGATSQIAKLKEDVRELQDRYAQRISEMPNADMYEFGIYNGSLLKGR